MGLKRTPLIPMRIKSKLPLPLQVTYVTGYLSTTRYGIILNDWEHVELPTRKKNEYILFTI